MASFFIQLTVVVVSSLRQGRYIYKAALGAIAVSIWPWGIISKPNNSFSFGQGFHQTILWCIRNTASIMKVVHLLSCKMPDYVCLNVSFFFLLGKFDLYHISFKLRNSSFYGDGQRKKRYKIARQLTFLLRTQYWSYFIVQYLKTFPKHILAHFWLVSLLPSIDRSPLVMGFEP